MLKYIAFLFFGAISALTGFGQQLPIKSSGEIQRSFHIRRTNSNLHNSADSQALALEINETFKQKLDSIIEYNFNETTGEWDINFRKESFAYDNAFNDTLFLLSAWDEDNNQWENLWRETTKYNEQNNMSGYTAYTWGTNQLWEPFYKEQYTYNNKDQLIETLFYTWKYAQKKWLLIEKTIHIYNPEGDLLADTVYYKYSESGEWVLAEKKEYEYTDGYLEFINSSVWETDSAKWFPDAKKQMFYDDEEWYQYSTREYNWDTTINDWKLTEAKTFGRDDDNNMNTSTKITISNDTTVLMEKFDFDYAIASDALLLPGVLNTNDKMAFHHMIKSKELKKFNRETKGREKYREVKFHYSTEEISTDINFSNSESIAVFPNPVQETLQIRLPGSDSQISFALFDINGKKILSKAITNGQNIDVSPLKSGIYFYIITSKKEKATGKLVKK